MFYAYFYNQGSTEIQSKGNEWNPIALSECIDTSLAIILERFKAHDCILLSDARHFKLVSFNVSKSDSKNKVLGRILIALPKLN